MKKPSKLMALLLALFMIASLFAACGDDKKDDNDKEDTSVSDEKDNDKKDKNTSEVTDNKTEENKTEENKTEGNTTEGNTTEGSKENKKDNTKPTGENVLIGEWENATDIEGFTYVTVFTFNKDGTVEVTYPKNSYDDLIEQVSETLKEDYRAMTEDILSLETAIGDDLWKHFSAEIFVSDEDLEKYIREYIPYEDLVNSFEWSGTWKLDGDKLIIKSADVTNTVETELSKGKTTFTFVDENGGVWHFKKIQ